MKAYRFQTSTRIEPLVDPVSEAQVGAEDLGLAVTRALSEAGLEPELGVAGDSGLGSGDCLVLPDRLFVTRKTVRTFVSTCPAEPGIYRLGLARGPATDWARPLQRVDETDGAIGAILYDLYLLRDTAVLLSDDWEAIRDELAGRARDVVLDPGSEAETLFLSRPGPPRRPVLLPRTDLLAVDVSHWVHVVWLNQLLPWVRLREHWQDRPWQARVLTGLERNPYRLAERMSVIGSGCDIHPTAHVEGSILGDGVVLGPLASVRDSIVADGVLVSEDSHFLRCAVGARCHALSDSHFIGCTFYPDSTLANFMLRDSLIGRRSFVTSGLVFWPEAIERTVHVVHQGEEIDTGRWILGSCAGHGSVLGSLGTRGVFAPGRALPNRTIVVMRPTEGVLKAPDLVEPLHPHVCQDGSVVPLQQALPDWRPPEIET